MKLSHVAVGAGLLAVLFSGCGKNLNGNYNGYDTVVASTQVGTTTNTITTNNTGQSINSQMTMQLTSSGDTVSGSWSDQTSTGTIQGTMSGGQLSNVVLLKSSNQPGLTSTTTGTYNIDYGCTTYTGSLSIGNDNELTGSLSAAAVSTYGSSSCSGYTRTFNLTHTN